MVNHRHPTTLVFLLWTTCFYSITTSAFIQNHFYSHSIDHVVSTKYNDSPHPFSTFTRVTTFRPLLPSSTFNTYAKPTRPNKSSVLTFMTLKEPERSDTTTDDDDDDENDPFPGIPYEKPEDKLPTTLTPLKSIPGAASFESPNAPTRYLLPLAPTTPHDANVTYAMIDVPPFTPELLEQVNDYVNGTISFILITNKNAVHYDDSASTVYVERRSELYRWVEALQKQQQPPSSSSPSNDNNITVVMHRTDVPRDMREGVTQALDGYGPWALQMTTTTTTTDDGEQRPLSSFEETGTPMRIVEWDDDLVKEMIQEAQRQESSSSKTTTTEDVDDTPTSSSTTDDSPLRQKEDGKPILAIHTPGHTMGSLSYIFPAIGALCSGFTIPEDDEAPRLDERGFVTTNRAGCRRQAESARSLVRGYADRFDVVLPSRGEILELGGEEGERRERLEGVIDCFERIGDIYDSLGITGGEQKK